MKIIIKYLLFFIIIIVLIPINVFAEDLDDELDYVWLKEEINEAKDECDLQINSKYAVAFDRESKTVIWGKNENTKTHMASTTKIMTAIVLLENINDLDEIIEVSKEAERVGGSKLGLNAGDKISYNDLLYGLMLRSGNDAAVQIANSVAGSISNFSNMMNNKAKKMGLKNTHFVTPHGLDNKEHYTTAKELAFITDYALNIDKFAKVVSTKNYTIKINGYPRSINNTNELLGYLDGVNGVKTGFTNKAGRCLVTSVNRDNFNIITVILGADTKKVRTSDSIKIIEYIYKNYELVDIEKIIEDSFKNWISINRKRIKIYKGVVEIPQIGLDNIKPKKIPVLKTEKSNINIGINNIYKFEAPIIQNKKIGELKVFLNTTEIMRLDIIFLEKIDKKTAFFYFKELLEKMPSIFYSHA